MIKNDQMPEVFRDIIDKEVEQFKMGLSIEKVDKIPDTKDIPLYSVESKKWLKINNVICVFVDMKNSTLLSSQKHPKTMAGAYQLFTGTAVRLFHGFDASYIDVRGDGVFALFNSDQIYRAIAAAITFKTFAFEVFSKKIKSNYETEIGAHIGIDIQSVLVKKIGLKKTEKRSDRKNEIWAGQPINMASKLCSKAKIDQLYTSDRYYNKITSDLVLKSCSCTDYTELWKEESVENDDKFKFENIYLLESNWCKEHGNDYCNDILDLDND